MQRATPAGVVLRWQLTLGAAADGLVPFLISWAIPSTRRGQHRAGSSWNLSTSSTPIRRPWCRCSRLLALTHRSGQQPLLRSLPASAARAAAQCCTNPHRRAVMAAQGRHDALARDQERRKGDPAAVLATLADARGPAGPLREFPAPNFDTYLTQRAARSRLQPVPAGHPLNAKGPPKSRNRHSNDGIHRGQSRNEHVRAGVGYHAASHPPV